MSYMPTQGPLNAAQRTFFESLPATTRAEALWELTDDALTELGIDPSERQLPNPFEVVDAS